MAGAEGEGGGKDCSWGVRGINKGRGWDGINEGRGTEERRQTGEDGGRRVCGHYSIFCYGIGD